MRIEAILEKKTLKLPLNTRDEYRGQELTLKYWRKCQKFDQKIFCQFEIQDTTEGPIDPSRKLKQNIRKCCRSQHLTLRYNIIWTQK